MLSKYCIECKHYKSIGNKCLRFRYFDIVTGKTRHYNANITRYSDNMCGREGKFFVDVKGDYDGDHKVIEQVMGEECVIICGQDGCGFIKSGDDCNGGVRYDASVEEDDNV